MSKYAVFFTLNKLLHKRADLAVALSWGAVSAGSTFELVGEGPAGDVDHPGVQHWRCRPRHLPGRARTARPVQAGDRAVGRVGRAEVVVGVPLGQAAADRLAGLAGPVHQVHRGHKHRPAVGVGIHEPFRPGGVQHATVGHVGRVEVVLDRLASVVVGGVAGCQGVWQVGEARQAALGVGDQLVGRRRLGRCGLAGTGRVLVRAGLPVARDVAVDVAGAVRVCR